ncbi:hypothetical protein JCM6882_000749 [Rhodosporidiobolus microsporus]
MTSSPPASTTPSLVVSTSPSPASSSPPASPLRASAHAGQPSAASITTPPPNQQRRSKSPAPSSPHHRTSSTSSARSFSSRARSLSPAPATSHSLSALGSPPGAHTTANNSGSMSPPQALPPPTSSAPSSSAGAPPVGSTIRPAPVVPPSPSVPPTPGFASSRPTSPRPSEPASPTRARATSGGAVAGGGPQQGGLLLSAGEKVADKGEGGMSRSGSQVDLSHIFERDVEFAPSHLITPSEAVDVAVPPVLTAAAEALSFSTSGDPLVAHELATLANEAEQEAQAGSGWSSPVLTPGGMGLYHPNAAAGGGAAAHPYAPHQSSPLHAHSLANASRSPVRGTSRSFSPDSNPAGRARSPDSNPADDGSSAAGFSVGTPPTSNSGGSPPPLSAGSPKAQPALGAGIIPLGPFGQRLAEALENEANKPGSSGAAATQTSGGKRDTSPESLAAKAASYTPLKPSLLLPFPAALSSSGAYDPSNPDPFSGFSPSSASASAISSSPLHSPSYESANPFAAAAALAGGAATAPSGGASPALAAPHPRRLSFYSYADLINEERIQELKGEGIGPAEVAGAGGGAREAGSRTVSGGSAVPPVVKVEKGGEGEEVETLQKGVEGVQIAA